MKLNRLLNVQEFEKEALRLLPRSVGGFLFGGAEDGHTLKENQAVFNRLLFRPQGLTGVSNRSQSIELWGKTYSSPIGISPIGVAALARHHCDLILARAAVSEQVPFILSGSSSVPLEIIAQHAPGSWYQGYLPGDVARLENLLLRLEAAKFETLVVTIDTPVGANRETNERNGFVLPLKLNPRLMWDGITHPAWTIKVFLQTLMRDGIPRFSNQTHEVGNPITQDQPNGFRSGWDKLDWDHLRWLRDRWKGRLLIKGVLHDADARKAVQCGLDGLIVSNHGGRQLDSSISTLQALPPVVAAVPRDFPVMIDGGFRRGTDVMKALALGARMVFMGRPMLAGAAVAGDQGVHRVINILRSEIDRNQALLGCADITRINTSYLAVASAPLIHTETT
jgi:L-lactate dehydrogenase (cytochrome)